MGEIILLTLWLCQSAADSFVQLGLLQEYCGAGEVAARCWDLGQGTEGALLMDELSCV